MRTLATHFIGNVAARALFAFSLLVTPLTSYGAWTPPIGIPAPSFGINEVAGTPTHYVNNAVACNDSNNGGLGSSAAPRCTVPTTLAAGSVVEVRGGPYVAASFTIAANGTAASPVFIKGVGKPIFKGPTINSSNRYFTVTGSYYVVEGIAVSNSDMVFSFGGHHGALRDSEIGPTDPPSFDPAVQGSGNNFVILRNHIHHNGNSLSTVEDDVHGVKFTSGDSYIWIVDNEMDHNGGQSVQIGDDVSPEPWPHHIYIGRNSVHDDREGGLYSKQARDVIFSQNDVWGAKVVPGGSAIGTAMMPCRFGAHRSWAIFNKVHDSVMGMRANGNNDVPAPADCYIIGNLYYNITSPSYSATDPYTDGAALNGWNNYNVNVIDNTFANVDKCISFNSSGTHMLSGNVCINSKDPMTFVSGAPGGGSQNYGFFGPVLRAAWGSVSPILNMTQLRSQGQCANCKEGNALLDANYRPQGGSPLIDASIRHTAYSTFQTLYGLSIDKDFDGKSRPQGAAWDMGAFEFGGSTPPPPPAASSGDLNADGAVNSLDLQLLVNVILGTETNAAIRSRADLNGDGSVNALDLQRLVNSVLGL